MLMKKQPTKYGYKAQIRYDTIGPEIHVIEPYQLVNLYGPTDIQVITGECTINRDTEGAKETKLEVGETTYIPDKEEFQIETRISKTVILMHQNELTKK